MKILVLGATGKVGAQILDVARQRGHEVTAFVRSPSKISRTDIAVVKGDPRDPVALAHAMHAHDAVLSSLGPSGREGLRPSTLMADLVAPTLDAMRRAGVRRLAIVSAAVLFDERSLFFRFFTWLLRHHRRDLEQMEAAIMRTDVEWTIARPPRLVARANETYVVGRRGLTCSHRAVAAFLLDSVESHTYVREIVGLRQ